MTQDGFTIRFEEQAARIALDREAQNNSFDDTLIVRLRQSLRDVTYASDVRVVILEARGPVFSTGADAAWLHRNQAADQRRHLEDAKAFASLLHVLDTMPVPTIAKVQGPAIGAAVGLVACCDVAIAGPAASFAITETRLGLIPAVTGPYIMRAIGSRAARRFFLTAEMITAETAKQLGLIHDLVETEKLEAAVQAVLGEIVRNGPDAIRAAKDMIAGFENMTPEAAINEACHLAARQQAGSEAREGLNAYFEKRDPNWLRSGTGAMIETD